MKVSSQTMANQMVLEDSLVKTLSFKVSGKVERFMELLLWFKIISPELQIKKKKMFASLHQATQLKNTYLLLELG